MALYDPEMTRELAPLEAFHGSIEGLSINVISALRALQPNKGSSIEHLLPCQPACAAS